METGNRDYCTHVVGNNNILLAFTSPLQPNEVDVNSHIAKHGDGVKDVAFRVDDARGIYQKAISRGAISIQEPQELSDDHGTVIVASLKTYGDTVHTLVQRVNYTGPFLPGFIRSELTEPFNKFIEVPDLQFVDHIVGN